MNCSKCSNTAPGDASGFWICRRCGYVNISSGEEVQTLIGSGHAPAAVGQKPARQNTPAHVQRLRILVATAVVFVLALGVLVAFGVSNSHAHQLLSQAKQQQTLGHYNQAAQTLNKASQAWALGSTQKEIKTEQAANTRWLNYQQQYAKVDALIGQKNYTEALTILQAMPKDYPQAASVKAKTTAVQSMAEPGAAVTQPEAVIAKPTQAPPKTTSPAPAAPSPIASNSTCRVDASQAPQFAALAQNLAKVCQSVMPQIEQRLSPSPCRPQYQIVFDDNKYAAYAWECVVHISISYASSNSFDPGLLPHELTHIVQGYTSNPPMWITEGIGTYMSYKLGYSIGIAHCNSNETYTSGYGCGASLFNYIERVYDPAIIKDVHYAVVGYSYSDSLFNAKTGRSLTQLYAECLNAECKGGGQL